MVTVSFYLERLFCLAILLGKKEKKVKETQLSERKMGSRGGFSIKNPLATPAGAVRRLLSSLGQVDGVGSLPALRRMAGRIG